MVDDPVVFRQADDLAVAGRQHADDGVAGDGHEMVGAGRPDVERTRHDELVAALDVVEFGELRRRREAALQQFLDIHAGDPGGRVAGVVIVAVVDQQDVEQLFDLAGRGFLHGELVRIGA